LSYIGQRPVVGRYIKLDQISSGFNGSNTGFSMTAGSQAVFPGTARNLLLSLGCVIQEPDTDFTISGSTLTFTTPPVANTTFFGVIYGDMQATGTPSDGTVLPASIASSGNFSFPEVTVTGDVNIADSIIHSGDTDTKIRFGAANEFSVETGGVERLELTGTETVFNDTGVDTDFRIEGDTNANLFKVDAGNDRVGIGTSSPQQVFHVYHAADNGLARFESGDANCRIDLVDNSGQSSIEAIGNQLRFGTSSSNTERMRISSTGNVGIGTTSPNAKFVISDSSTFTAYGGSVPSIGDCMQSLSNVPASEAINNHATFQFGVNGGSHNRVNSISAVAESASNRKLAFAFCTDSGSNRNERMRISADGNVGIGTASPAELLHLQSTAGNTKLRLTQSGSTTDALNGAIHFGNSTDGQLCEIRGYTSGATNSGYLQFRTTNSGSDVTAMTINTAGSVGIGTASPTSVLHVDKGLSGAPLVTFHQLNGSSGADAGLEVETSSTGTYIQRWMNSGTEHARITGAGLMGIGTTVPTCLLNVNTGASGTHTAIEITRTTHGTVGKFRNSTGALEIQSNKQLILSSDPAQGMTAEGSMIQFLVDGGEKARIDAGGRLLIGTTSITGISGSGDDIVIGSIGDSTSRGITFATTNDGTIRWADAGDNAMGRIQYLNGSDVMTFHTTNAERFKIDGSGNIGVNVLDANGGLFQMKPYHNFDDDAADLATSASKATLRVRTSSNSSMSLYIGGLDDSIDSARPYLQVGNLSTGGATAFYDLYLCPFGGIVRTRQVMPMSDNLYDLGSSSNRWDDVFATNDTIQTSDRNEKNTIVDSDLGLSFINKLKPVSYKFNDRTRTHYGLIAQDIETVLSDISKSTTDFAGFIKSELSDTLYTEDEPLPTGKNVGDVKTPGSTHYGLRYGEFIAPLIKAVQELSAKVAALEAA